MLLSCFCAIYCVCQKKEKKKKVISEFYSMANDCLDELVLWQVKKKEKKGKTYLLSSTSG